MDDLIKIKEIDGKLITTSRNVAHVFTKEHKNVLRTIDGLKMSNEFRRLNYELTDFIDKNGDKQRKYLMTRDGWTILVMGFKDENAMRFKELYIAKFNEMEKGLSNFSHMTKLDWIELARSQEIEKLALIESNQLLENKIQKDQPLVEFASNIQESNDAISIGEFAKILSKNGYEIGQNRLFKKLRELKLLFYMSGKNQPYQTAIEAGWFKLDEFNTQVKKRDSDELIDKLCTKITVTGKGQVYVERKLRELISN